MKKQKTIIVLAIATLLSFNISFAQNATNRFDENGKRHGIWKKYYNNDRIRYVGKFNHGKELGTFKFYSAASSDFPVVIKVYNNENNTANVKFYSKNGLLQSKGLMKGKKRVGKWFYYHEDGKSIMSEENYNDGKLDGSYKTFYKTGKPTEIAYYKNGLLDSTYKKYSIKGHLYQHFTYKYGKLNGNAVYYNRKTGEISTKGQFKDDLRVGTWENYVDGELISTEQPNKKKERKKKVTN